MARKQLPKSLNKVEFWRKVCQVVTKARNRLSYLVKTSGVYHIYRDGLEDVSLILGRDVRICYEMI